MVSGFTGPGAGGIQPAAASSRPRRAVGGGVALTEKDIASRRPGSQDYIRRTSAFVPLPPRR